jgi:uncharacterized membrane protein YecN with MAPEG domain
MVEPDQIMHLPHITLTVGSVLGLMFFILSFLTIRGRVKKKVAVGRGAGGEVSGLVRAHGNFAEYVPLILILMALVELPGGGPARLGILGGGLILGRLLHAYGMIASNGGEHWGRVAGTLLTLLALVWVSIEGLLAVYF